MTRQLQNNSQPTRYALTTNSGHGFCGGYGIVSRTERGTYRLRVTAGKRNVTIPQMSWGGGGGFGWRTCTQ